MNLSVAPGPRSLIGTFPGMWGEADRMYKHVEYAMKYGDVVRHSLGPIVVHVLRHPDHIKHVLQENHANYSKGRGLQKMKAFLGEGLLTSEGDYWRRQRRLAQPAFHRQRLREITETMAACTEKALARWKHGDRIDLSREMMKLTLNIAATTLFGADVSGEADAVGAALTVALKEANRRIFTFFDFPMSVPTPKNVRMREAVATLDRVVYGIIEERRRAKNGSGKNDLLAMLMEARDADTGEAMSDKQLRDEVMTIFLAGHETTANALSWTFYLLSKAPSEDRKLEADVMRVLGSQRAPTFDELPRLERARMVLEEALRLYPPAWVFGRTAKERDHVGDYEIPKGSLVAIVPFMTHRHPDFWPNPEGFDPERFLQEASEGRHKYAYLPFGAGPRVCIGNQFAMIEGQLILSMIAARFRLSLVPGARVEPEAMITLRPKGGVPMIVESR